MASLKTYNAIDCKQQLLMIEIKKGKSGGYNRNLLVNCLNELEIEFFVCTKCNGVMRNACQIGEEQFPACEVCVGHGEIAQPMAKSRKKIPELRVKCPLERRGCIWKGNLGEIEQHLDLCPEFVVNCSNQCGVILRQSELTNHRENECQLRNIDCEFCQVSIQYNEREIHFKACLEFPVKCPNKCTKSLVRKETKSHTDKDCPNTIVNCKNKCGMILKRSKLNNHSEFECENRKVKCKYCKTVMLYKELETHNNTCVEFPLSCPNACLKNLSRKDLESHIETECPNTFMECPYKKMGCEKQVKRCELDEHRKKFESKHLEVSTLYTLSRVEELEKSFRSQEQAYKIQIKELKAENNDLTAQLINMEKTQIHFRNELDEMGYKMMDLLGKKSYSVVLKDEISEEFISIISNKVLFNMLFDTPTPSFHFIWNQLSFRIIFQYKISQQLILAKIQLQCVKENPEVKPWPLSTKFKLTLVDKLCVHHSLVFESDLQKLEPILEAKDKPEEEKPFKDVLILAEIPRCIILEDRLRNENNLISFVLQMQGGKDVQM